MERRLTLMLVLQVALLGLVSLGLVFAGYVYIKSYRAARWEYKCVYTDREMLKSNNGSFHKYLDLPFTHMGAEGWEMVGYAMNDGVNARVVCFKRPWTGEVLKELEGE